MIFQVNLQFLDNVRIVYDCLNEGTYHSFQSFPIDFGNFNFFHLTTEKSAFFVVLNFKLIALNSH